MNSADLITIFGNISHSLAPLQQLFSGGAYVLGIIFIISAFLRFVKISDSRPGAPSQEKMFAPLMHLLIGTLLLYLPTALNLAANTAFGVGNILTYSPYPTSNVANLIKLFIQTAGILWFIRGCVLVVHSSEPGTKHAFKGLAFIIAGILAANFDNTVSMLNSVVGQFAAWSISFKSS